MSKHLIIIFCMLLLTTFLNGQIKGRLSLSEDQKTYQFYITPDFSQGPPFSITNSAQISLVAPVGGLKITNFRSIVGNWNGADVDIIESPIENQGAVYLSIPLASPLQQIVYEKDVEILLFTFENEVPCLGSIKVVDNQTDPFLPPNSKSVNIGNLFTILAFGPVNVYEGTEHCCDLCPGEEIETPEEEEEEKEIVGETEQGTDSDGTPPTTQGTLCNGNTVSHIDISLSATGTPPYKAVWTNITSGIKDSMDIEEINGPYRLITNAAPGIYEITLTDSKGRKLNLIEEVLDNSYLFSPQLSVTNAVCGGSSSGRIAILDASANYSYQWSNGDTGISEIQDLTPNTYEVTVTDSKGCSVIQKATITVEGGIDASISITDISCKDRKDGNITVNVPNPNAYTYQWEGNGITSKDFSIDNLPPGDYAVTISDPNGLCEEVQVFKLTEPEKMTVSAKITATDLCELAEDGVIVVDKVSNAQGVIRYALDDNEFDTKNRFNVATGATHKITAIDEMGCTASTIVDIPEASGLELNLPEKMVLELGDEMELKVNYKASSNVYFEWEANESLSCTDCPNPIINPTQTTTYTLILSDDNGCSKEATIIVFLSKTDKIYTPNAFSPNNDGVNDYFNIFTGNNVLAVNSLQVFNRWGDRVFQSNANYTANNIQVGWDGSYNGQKAEPAVYIYAAEIMLLDGTSEIIKGEVNLIR